MTTGHNLTAARCIVLALLAILGVQAWGGSIAATGRNLSVEELMRSLAQVKSAKGKFVERKFLRILNEPLELRGTLTYIAPGHLEKHTLTPKPESLVLDGDTLTFEDKVRKQRRTLRLQEFPVLWAFVESIRSTLAGDLQSLNRFYEVALEGNAADWRLLLKPRETKMRSVVSEIQISGREQSVRVIDVFESGGDRSEMTIIEEKQ